MTAGSHRFLPPGLGSRLAAAAPGSPAVLTGVAGGTLPFLVSLLPGFTGRPIAFVLPSTSDAESVLQDSLYYARALGTAEPVLLPPLEPEPYLGVSPHLQSLVDRALAFHHTLGGGGGAAAILVPAEAWLLRLPPPEVTRDLTRVVTRGDRVDRDELALALVRAGYRRQDMVGTVGDFAVRGGILDVYSPAAPEPFRLELLGDAVDSIRRFDPVSQRSEGEAGSAALLPLTPFPLAAAAEERLRAWGASLPDDAEADLRARREELRGRGTFAGIEYYAPAFVSPLVDLSAYLPGYDLALVEPDAVRAALEKARASLEELHGGARARHLAVPPPEALATGPAEWQQILGGASLHLQAVGAAAGTAFSLRAQPARRYEGRIKELVQDLAQDVEAGLDAVVVLPTPGEAERVEAMLSEYEVSYVESERALDLWRPDQAAPAAGHGRVAVAIGRLSQGFRSPLFSLAVHAAPEVFGHGVPARRRRARGAAFASDFRDLRIGDFVVHVDHGIARFQGLKSVEVAGVAKEFMVLSYADDGKLYVPLDRLDLVQKYQGMEAHAPRVDTLGGTAWAKVKTRVKGELRSMAQDLLNLYASRRVMKGHAFSPDGLFQKEFEDAFPYVETPDQAAAIVEVKRDMESARCMDRLVCGDVGYGKTEVAMRAAFKAVADGKQVAVLAPTTILAYQHDRTFRERFQAFPVRIEMVSRFRARKEIDAVLADLARGTVDVLIGTHRVLGKDVAFRDLGLLIVDEEQRFGVAHKEKLKQVRQGIDVLTLSATPIPRTLQMAFSGLRDMSVIETPPKDRLAIETSVVRFDPKVIKEAIKHEIERGGQVFFVHNRVESIHAMADALHKIAPFARVVVGHGQMPEGELEKAMLTFAERKADVLLATTIIENGLDMPNVNTILINRAHRLGLAQLYQLRGRVGRSDRAAYAFLLIPTRAELTAVARRRLHAIQEFTELGSGFRVAALDLQIRGAGNVLGREQHGHIAAVGFDLYMELLEQTMRELKGEAPEEVRATISLGIDVHVPEDYVADPHLRLMVYKKVAGARSVPEVDDVEREIADRFGAPPRPVGNLLEGARLKLEATAVGVVAVEREGPRARLRFAEGARVDTARLVAFAGAAPGRRLHPDGRLEIPVPAGGEAVAAIRRAVAEIGAAGGA